MGHLLSHYVRIAVRTLMKDPFLQAAIEEARQGKNEGGIPIGSVIVHQSRIIGRGHNRRVQRGSAILHGEMDALENAGRQPASVYRECVLYTTLSPCSMCSGAILLYGIRRVIVGENQTFMGEEELLGARGVSVEVLQDEECIRLMREFIGPTRGFGTRISESDARNRKPTSATQIWGPVTIFNLPISI